MFSFSALVSLARRHRIRQAAIRDLHRLSREQLYDVGLTPEQIGEIVDGMLARTEHRGEGTVERAVTPLVGEAAWGAR